MVSILGFQLRSLCINMLAIQVNQRSRTGLNVIENCLQISLISDWISPHCQSETKENLLLKKIVSFITSTVFITQYLTFIPQIPGMPRVMNKRKTDIKTRMVWCGL